MQQNLEKEVARFTPTHTNAHQCTPMHTNAHHFAVRACKEVVRHAPPPFLLSTGYSSSVPPPASVPSQFSGPSSPDPSSLGGLRVTFPLGRVGHVTRGG